MIRVIVEISGTSRWCMRFGGRVRNCGTTHRAHNTATVTYVCMPHYFNSFTVSFHSLQPLTSPLSMHAPVTLWGKLGAFIVTTSSN